MIDLRSDTVTCPPPEMRRAMLEAEVGDDVFAEDPTINKLQDKVAALLNKEAALFVPSGTQGNQICINVHTSPGEEVVCDYNAHIFNYESGAPGLMSGVQLHPITGEHGHPTVEQIEEVLRPGDDHYPQTALICLENTHNRAGGTIYPYDQLQAISGFARSKKLKIHLDGARLWNAHVATGIPLADYASLFDSVSLCFSKGLGAPVGSVIAGSQAFIRRAHYYRKAYGGGMRQAGILAAACIYAINNNVARLAEDHENARRLAQILNTIPGFSVDLSTVETNIVIADVQKSGKSAPEISELLKTEHLFSIPFSKYRLRFVTHLHISKDDIRNCETIFRKIID